MSKVVVTGGFQYLHEGHKNLLRKAKELGDIIVLLNSDESLLRTKGYLGEPFEIRKRSLEELNWVEDIIEISEDPTSVLKELQPDYQVCGSDHSKEEVMEKGGRYVGKIVIMPYTEGISSTKIYRERKCQR